MPPTPTQMKLLALVLALSVNSRPSAPNCAISSLGFRRLPTWRIMATRHPRGPLTRSAREFGVYGGLTTQVRGARLIIGRCTKFISSGDSESPVTDFEVDQDAEIFENFHCTDPDHGQGAFALSWRAGSGQD